ncbi:DUF4236 domain-containing protein [Halovulum sp. GXIMD14794]
MGLRFRKSVKVMPGVRLNFSGSGVSTTVGVRGASVNFGKRGVYGTAGIPGTGLSMRERLDKPAPKPKTVTRRKSAAKAPVEVRTAEELPMEDAERIAALEGIRAEADRELKRLRSKSPARPEREARPSAEPAPLQADDAAPVVREEPAARAEFWRGYLSPRMRRGRGSYAAAVALTGAIFVASVLAVAPEAAGGAAAAAFDAEPSTLSFLVLVGVMGWFFPVQFIIAMQRARDMGLPGVIGPLALGGAVALAPPAGLAALAVLALWPSRAD